MFLVVLFYINWDDSFVTWSIPNKACGAISYEVTFFTPKSIYKIHKLKISKIH